MLATPKAGQRLADRGVLFVPDIISSAGAVVEGVGRTVMGLADTGPLIDALGATAGEVLQSAKASGQSTTEVAEQRARKRIEARRSTGW